MACFPSFARRECGWFRASNGRCDQEVIGPTDALQWRPVVYFFENRGGAKMDEDDREARLFHGTTYDVANAIVTQQRFDLKETFFTPSRELAAFFAKRTCAKVARGSQPAVVRAVLYASDLRVWKESRLWTSKGFDEGDQPMLRGKVQMVFTAEGVRLLNKYMFPSELVVERVSGE